MKIELFRDWPDDELPCWETNRLLWQEFLKLNQLKNPQYVWTEAEVVQWIDLKYSENNMLELQRK